jgi:hypothetical protein
MRSCLILALGLTVMTAHGAVAATPYYGPYKGGLVSQGYSHTVEKNGDWRITVTQITNPYRAFDAALYRAAEMAREAGYPYVQMLHGGGSSTVPMATAVVYARPSADAAPPAQCRARTKECYTADVAKVLYALSGDSGREPGEAKLTRTDEYGRRVTASGFGVGAVSWSSKGQPIAAPHWAPPPPAVLPPEEDPNQIQYRRRDGTGVVYAPRQR